MKLQRAVWTLAACVLLSPASQASVISFDPDGSGGAGTYSVGAFDFLQGNSLSQDVLLGGVGHEWTLYYQAVLGSMVDANGNVIAGSGLNVDYQITAVAAITVQTTSLSGAVLNFQLAANPTHNFMRLYHDTNLNANALAGTGFNDGTLILDSSAGSDLFGTFLFTTMNAGALDQFNTNDWAGVNTRGGIGAISLAADVSYSNDDFFILDPNELLTIMFSNSSQIVPFRETDPSRQFWDGTDYVLTSIGSHNGVTGPDVIIQADSNASFVVVPEASSMVLCGIGAGLLSVLGVRRRKSSI